MKLLKVITVLSFLFISMAVKSQTNINHPTISSVTVMYKAVPQPTGNVANSNLSVNVIPQVTVSLIAQATVSTVYFKILDPVTNVIIYQSNYTINSSPQLNVSGKKLFENINGSIFLSNGSSLALKPYLFQITTGDNQQVLSPIFSSK
jgi:hypothetical protein